eukprot:86366_1
MNRNNKLTVAEEIELTYIGKLFKGVSIVIIAPKMITGYHKDMNQQDFQDTCLLKEQIKAKLDEAQFNIKQVSNIDFLCQVMKDIKYIKFNNDGSKFARE